MFLKIHLILIWHELSYLVIISFIILLFHHICGAYTTMLFYLFYLTNSYLWCRPDREATTRKQDIKTQMQPVQETHVRQCDFYSTDGVQVQKRKLHIQEEEFWPDTDFQGWNVASLFNMPTASVFFSWSRFSPVCLRHLHSSCVLYTKCWISGESQWKWSSGGSCSSTR